MQDDEQEMAMTSENAVKEDRAGNPDDVRKQPQVALKWRRGGGRYYAEYLELGMAAEVGRSGAAYWYAKAWPHPLADSYSEVEPYVRHVTGLRTMADARAMVTHMPCFRCGRGRPLILMEVHTVRFRCIDHATCERERARLTGR
jgi:hypothetical protein